MDGLSILILNPAPTEFDEPGMLIPQREFSVPKWV
jgi:hypothetical protein